MRKSYLILMPFTFIFLFAAFWLLGAVPPYYFTDPPAMLVMLLVLLLVFCTFRPSEIVKYIKLAFQESAQDSSELENALHFFRTFQAYAFYMAIVTFMMALIFILTAVPDLSNTGPYLAVAFLTVLYALMLTVFVTLPFRASLQKKLNELGSSR
ncbi:MAG: hypothetical protein FVQ81_07350 [Candidatus Glassbacteria bacterium]|nr:hypothetical protein [Candidatus Glassbacteria bacterium]